MTRLLAQASQLNDNILPFSDGKCSGIILRFPFTQLWSNSSSCVAVKHKRLLVDSPIIISDDGFTTGTWWRHSAGVVFVFVAPLCKTIAQVRHETCTQNSFSLDPMDLLYTTYPMVLCCFDHDGWQEWSTFRKKNWPVIKIESVR